MKHQLLSLLMLGLTTAQQAFFTSCDASSVGLECCYVSDQGSDLGTCETETVRYPTTNAQKMLPFSPLIPLIFVPIKLSLAIQVRSEIRYICDPGSLAGSTQFFSSCDAEELGGECCVTYEGKVVGGECISEPVSLRDSL